MDDQVPRTDIPSTSTKGFWEKTKGGIPDAVANVIVGALVTVFLVAGTAFKDQILTWLHTKHNNSPKVLQTTAARDQDIYNILVELRTQLKSDRALVRQFHNGDYWSNGTPMRKISTSYESDRLGVSSVFELVRSMPMSQVPDLLEKLTQGGGLLTAKTMGSGGFHDLMTVQGVEHCFVVPLFMTGTDDQMIGVLEVHWLSDETPIPAPEADKAASRIEFLLSRAS